MFKEFKTFIARGNVMDMAVGIIMGAAFTAIVNSAVGDLIMPVIGYLTNGVDFSEKSVTLGVQQYETMEAAQAAGAVAITYGLFINAVINFLIIAFCVFLLVKGVNNLKRKAEDPNAKDAPPPSKDIVLLTEIRDALVKAPAKKPAAKKAPAKKKTAKKK